MSDSPGLVVALAGSWAAIGLVLSIVMGRRGHNSFAWLVLGTLLGPLAVALAIDSRRHDEQLGRAPLEGGTGAIPAGPVDVLVGYDGSPQSAAALAAAVDLLGDRLGRLTVASIVSYGGVPAEERSAREALRSLRRHPSGPEPQLEILHGHPSAALRRCAIEGGYELIAIGTRGAGLSKALLGSAASELARDSNVPVLLVGGSAQARYSRTSVPRIVGPSPLPSQRHDRHAEPDSWDANRLRKPHSRKGTTVKRRTLDILFSIGGVGLAALLLVIGVVMSDNADFSKKYVTDQLKAQKITFKAADALTDEERKAPCLITFAGQELTIGKQAECYANEFIGLHVKTSGKGLTYAEIGDAQTALRAQIATAQRNDDPGVADLQKQLADLTAQRETVFKGETLRGILLTSYGFSELGNKADQAATVIYLGVVLLVALSMAGFVHAFVTPKSKGFAVPEGTGAEMITRETVKV